MPGPHPSVAATRCAVRDALAAVPPDALILVACSGGPDSLAVAAAVAFEAPRAGVRGGAVVVDHRLQPDSAAAADRAAATCRDLGLDPVVTVSVDVPGQEFSTGAHQQHARGGPSSTGGPEAQARQARYRAFDQVAHRHDAHAVWLGHTRDDQAEQVLLGLCRGSGTRSLAGIPPTRGPYVRPFLGIDRQTTESACAAQGLDPWLDPTNDDPAYLRNRVRRALADLEADLGPGLTAALARSADLARQDADALDDYADQARVALGPPPWPAAAVASQPAAIRGRLWRALAAQAGAPALTSAHVAALDALVSRWRGQGPVHLPGGAVGSRSAGHVNITATGREQ